MTLSIVIPVLNEAARIAAALGDLASYRRRGVEIIVVDGGSDDHTPDLAFELVDRVIAAPRGRALQMNAGAAIASGDALLFLHADTRLPRHADRAILEGLARSGRAWGRFDVSFDRGGIFGVIAAAMNMRSRLTGIATGDQAMFVRRTVFEAAGGFQPIALMEDVEFSARLKHVSRPLCIGTPVTSSARRWQSQGILRTILLMWRLRLSYYLGADPAKLARIYGYADCEGGKSGLAA